MLDCAMDSKTWDEMAKKGGVEFWGRYRQGLLSIAARRQGGGACRGRLDLLG